MWRHWCWWMVVLIAHAGVAAANDDDCVLLDGNEEIRLARKANDSDRRATTAGLRRDPGNLELHHRAVADYVLGKRSAAQITASVLALIERCPASGVLAHPRVRSLQRPALARAWERSVRRSPSPGSLSNYYGYQLRGKTPTIRARRHAGATLERLDALLSAHFELSEKFGDDDRTVRAVARRGHQLGEKLLQNAVAIRLERARMMPLSQVDPEPVPISTIERVARAAYGAGKLRRAEELAALVLMNWSRSGRTTTYQVAGALSVLADVAGERGNRSLQRALLVTIDERNDPWR